MFFFLQSSIKTNNKNFYDQKRIFYCLFFFFDRGYTASCCGTDMCNVPPPEPEISCLKGIKVDGSPGFNNKNLPIASQCQPGETCLRVEIDELETDTGSKSQLNYF